MQPTGWPTGLQQSQMTMMQRLLARLVRGVARYDDGRAASGSGNERRMQQLLQKLQKLLAWRATP